FNTVDIGALAPAALLVLVILMFIGASPGSTGGGIKTTTLAVVITAIKSKIQGRDKINVFNRSMAPGIVTVAAMIIVLALIVVSAGTFLLSIFELGNNSEWTFLDILFEVVSAFGTVGLSTGPTFELSSASKLVITLIMFLGRVGPLTFLFAVSRHIKVKRMEYIEESIMVG
ncbi:MAG: potassium transporter TrkG, partial [bacterium]